MPKSENVYVQAAALEKQQTTELSFLQTSAFVDQIYMYAGLAVDNKHETGFIAKEIRKHNYQTVIRLFTSLDDATFRAVLWDQAVHCLVWPPFVRYPGISETAKTDLRAYTAAGNNVVFIGNYVAVQFMNDVYGFQLMDDYQNGPYYRYVNLFISILSAVDHTASDSGMIATCATRRSSSFRPALSRFTPDGHAIPSFIHDPEEQNNQQSAQDVTKFALYVYIPFTSLLPASLAHYNITHLFSPTHVTRE